MLPTSESNYPPLTLAEFRKKTKGLPGNTIIVCQNLNMRQSVADGVQVLTHIIVGADDHPEMLFVDADFASFSDATALLKLESPVICIEYPRGNTNNGSQD